MNLQDEVYGHHQVSEPLLLDLLSSSAVKRLDCISQAGASSFVRKGRSVSRFEHSVGVMLLTRMLGGAITEQAAGLLQDVSHTAFSHTIDYVFQDRNEEFHETVYDAVVSASDLPGILRGHGLTWEQLFESANLGIVDAKAPMLCADRIDYTLRDLVRFGHICPADARRFVASLEVVEGVVACTDESAASDFVGWYSYLVEHLFMNPLELYAHDELSDIIREAMRRGIVSESDLFTTDSLVIEKLNVDEQSNKRLKDLRATQQVVAGDGIDARRVFSKGRTIDPQVLRDGILVPLSRIRPGLDSVWTNIRKISEEGRIVRRVT